MRPFIPYLWEEKNRWNQNGLIEDIWVGFFNVKKFQNEKEILTLVTKASQYNLVALVNVLCIAVAL